MGIFNATMDDVDCISPLIAKFRVELGSLRNVESIENQDSAKKEFAEYIEADYPIFIYKENDQCLGYLVCRVEMWDITY